MNIASYCNPTPLPNYPQGMLVPEKETTDYGWTYPSDRRDFREAADPAVLYFEGRWYMYVSCGSAYVSSDFINWKQHRIEPYNAEYDPRVTQVGDRFIFTASRTALFEGATPLGPFTKLGTVTEVSGEPASWQAPHIFEDDDGRVYAYWGIAGPGLFGAEMDAADPTRLVTERKVMFRYNRDHVWERFGASNEDPTLSYVEGPWLFKHDQRYYLTYSAPGTEWETYAFGYYVSDHPLGPFTYGKGNPFVRKTSGYVVGTGHGCIAPGPNGTLWAFYTCLVRNEHNFERRVGYDQVFFDNEGVPCCSPTELPQTVPGNNQAVDWLPLTINKRFACSSAQNRNASGRYALDNYMRTWWLPCAEDSFPSLEVFLKEP